METKKRNWTLIILWMLVIGLIGSNALLFKGLIKAHEGKASKFDLEQLSDSVEKLYISKVNFSEKGIQKINDKIMITIENIEKYLDGYKIELGVLNTSAITLDNIKLNVHKKIHNSFLNNYVYFDSININKQIESGTMKKITYILEKTTLDELKNSDWAMSFNTAVYKFKDGDK